MGAEFFKINFDFFLDILAKKRYSIIVLFAVVAELAYAHDSGSCPRKWVRVQVPSTAVYILKKS